MNTALKKLYSSFQPIPVKHTIAASIKASLDNIGAKDIYIQDLQREMARKDSLNMALVLNLKGAIGDLDLDTLVMRKKMRQIQQQILTNIKTLTEK